MEVRGEEIFLKGPESRIAQLPGVIPVRDALATAAQVFVLEERQRARADYLSLSPIFSIRARGQMLSGELNLLRQVGVQLAKVGAPDLGDMVEAFLLEQTE